METVDLDFLTLRQLPRWEKTCLFRTAQHLPLVVIAAALRNQFSNETTINIISNIGSIGIPCGTRRWFLHVTSQCASSIWVLQPYVYNGNCNVCDWWTTGVSSNQRSTRKILQWMSSFALELSLCKHHVFRASKVLHLRSYRRVCHKQSVVPEMASSMTIVLDSAEVYLVYNSKILLQREGKYMRNELLSAVLTRNEVFWNCAPE